MNKIKLSDRLSSVVSLLNKGEIAADIGSDHGLLSNYIAEEGIFKLVYSTEVSDKSIEPCRLLIDKRQNNKIVIPVVGKGLEPILDIEVDTIIITGMGGQLIINILSKHESYIKDKTLVLQPQRDSDKLRSYLRDTGFKIDREKLAIDGKFYYEVMRAIKGYQPHYLNDLLSKDLAKECDDKFIRYIEYSLKEYEYLINKLKSNPSAAERINELRREVKIYKEVLNGCKNKRGH